MTGSCAFCNRVLPDTGRHTTSGVTVVAVEDAYPSAAGHTLVIPRRHVARLTELDPAEAAELWSVAIGELRRLDAAGPDAFTVGVNDGEAAGQTIAHVHLHLIPRRAGDVTDPRGGVRLVLPDTARYWETGPATGPST